MDCATLLLSAVHEPFVPLVMSVEKPPPSQSTHPPAHGTLSTCSVLGRVLQRRQLQAADELFLMNDFEIISEVHGALETIKNLLNEPT